MNMIWLRLLPFIIAAAAIGVALWFWGDAISWKAEADKYKTALQTALEVNENQTAKLEQSEKLRKHNEDLAVHLAKENDELTSQVLRQQDALFKLREENEDVDSYYKSPAPEPLQRMYPNGQAIGPRQD